MGQGVALISLCRKYEKKKGKKRTKEKKENRTSAKIDIREAFKIARITSGKCNSQCES